MSDSRHEGETLDAWWARRGTCRWCGGKPRQPSGYCPKCVSDGRSAIGRPSSRARDQVVLYDLCVSLIAKADLMPEDDVRAVVDWLHEEAEQCSKNDRMRLLEVAGVLLEVLEAP